ncbi:MAG: DNA repair protein RecO [Spirochaetia bacterium]|nr:DNA repair protein RecO [Spirochaetia bacterium]MBP5739905.1 DNA repair protein RecO [Spirochaetia bacterium]
MNRYTELDGIILKNSRIGEFHKGVRIFSPEYGITEATAYGGYKPKSKIGPLVSPLACGHFVLYQSPSARKPKIEDFSPEYTFLQIQTDIKKYYTVLTWFEVVMRTHGGGDSSSELFYLLIASMQLLEVAKEDEILYINVQFLLRFLNLMGFPPVSYFQKSDSMVKLNKLSAGVFKYLDYTLGLPFDQAVHIRLGRKDAALLEQSVLSMVQGVLECTLNTLSGAFDIVRNSDEI